VITDITINTRYIDYLSKWQYLTLSLWSQSNARKKPANKTGTTPKNLAAKYLL
jgi:hypothetical protein